MAKTSNLHSEEIHKLKIGKKCLDCGIKYIQEHCPKFDTTTEIVQIVIGGVCGNCGSANIEVRFYSPNWNRRISILNK